MHTCIQPEPVCASRSLLPRRMAHCGTLTPPCLHGASLQCGSQHCSACIIPTGNSFCEFRHLLTLDTRPAHTRPRIIAIQPSLLFVRITLPLPPPPPPPPPLPQLFRFLLGDYTHLPLFTFPSYPPDPDAPPFSFVFSFPRSRCPDMISMSTHTR